MVFKTAKCVICGNKATHWDGALRVYTKNCLGGLIPRDMDIGFCDKHYKTEPYYCIGSFKPEYGVCDKDAFGHEIFVSKLTLWLDKNTKIETEVINGTGID